MANVEKDLGKSKQNSLFLNIQQQIAIIQLRITNKCQEKMKRREPLAGGSLKRWLFCVRHLLCLYLLRFRLHGADYLFPIIVVVKPYNGAEGHHHH